MKLDIFNDVVFSKIAVNFLNGYINEKEFMILLYSYIEKNKLFECFAIKSKLYGVNFKKIDKNLFCEDFNDYFDYYIKSEDGLKKFLFLEKIDFEKIKKIKIKEIYFFEKDFNKTYVVLKFKKVLKPKKKNSKKKVYIYNL